MDIIQAENVDYQNEQRIMFQQSFEFQTQQKISKIVSSEMILIKNSKSEDIQKSTTVSSQFDKLQNTISDLKCSINLQGHNVIVNQQNSDVNVNFTNPYSQNCRSLQYNQFKTKPNMEHKCDIIQALSTTKIMLNQLAKTKIIYENKIMKKYLFNAVSLITYRYGPLKPIHEIDQISLKNIQQRDFCPHCKTKVQQKYRQCIGRINNIMRSTKTNSLSRKVNIALIECSYIISQMLELMKQYKSRLHFNNQYEFQDICDLINSQIEQANQDQVQVQQKKDCCSFFSKFCQRLFGSTNKVDPEQNQDLRLRSSIQGFAIFKKRSDEMKHEKKVQRKMEMEREIEE